MCPVINLHARSALHSIVQLEENYDRFEELSVRQMAMIRKYSDLLTVS